MHFILKYIKIDACHFKTSIQQYRQQWNNCLNKTLIFMYYHILQKSINNRSPLQEHVIDIKFQNTIKHVYNDHTYEDTGCNKIIYKTKWSESPNIFSHVHIELLFSLHTFLLEFTYRYMQVWGVLFQQ